MNVTIFYQLNKSTDLQVTTFDPTILSFLNFNCYNYYKQVNVGEH